MRYKDAITFFYFFILWLVHTETKAISFSCTFTLKTIFKS